MTGAFEPSTGQLQLSLPHGQPPQDEPQHPPQGQSFFNDFMNMWNEKMTVSNANEPSGAPAMNVPSGKKCVLYAAYNVIRVTRA